MNMVMRLFLRDTENKKQVAVKVKETVYGMQRNPCSAKSGSNAKTVFIPRFLITSKLTHSVSSFIHFVVLYGNTIGGV